MIAQDLWQAHDQILLKSFSVGIHKIKCKYGHDDKKCEALGIKYKDCERCFGYKNVKDYLMKYKCSCHNRIYSKMFDEKLKK